MKKLLRSVGLYGFKQMRRLQLPLEKLIHTRRLEGHAWQDSSTYREYLDNQLRRTLVKKSVALPARTPIIVDKLMEVVDIKERDILCVGSRNDLEVQYLLDQGAKSAIGIDLYCNSELVQIMDMHQMTFPDRQFDLIYSSHSLEHAYDAQKVAQEFMRVGRSGAVIAIEVPANYELSSADLIDFKDCATLHALFQPHIDKVLLCEELPVDAEGNMQATDIVRTVFSIA